MIMTPAEAYQRSVKNGINYINTLIREYSGRGFVAFELEKTYWLNPEVLNYFKKLGYKYDDHKNELSWANAGCNH